VYGGGRRGGGVNYNNNNNNINIDFVYERHHSKFPLQVQECDSKGFSYIVFWFRVSSGEQTVGKIEKAYAVSLTAKCYM